LPVHTDDAWTRAAGIHRPYVTVLSQSLRLLVAIQRCVDGALELPRPYSRCVDEGSQLPLGRLTRSGAETGSAVLKAC
jgi:hypothetical protein